MAWQLSLLPEVLRGSQKDASTADIYLELALKIEAALADPSQVLLGISFGFAKCFAVILHTILWGVVEGTVLSDRILRPLGGGSCRGGES